MNELSNSNPPPKSSAASLGFWSTLAIIALVVMLVLAFYRRPLNVPSGAEDALVGRSLGVINLAPLTGDPPAIDDESLLGKVTLVNFWGTWCPPCIKEFPHLDSLRQELASEEDFRLAAVSCEPEDMNRLRKETQAFLEARQSNLPTYYDPNGMTRKAFMMADSKTQFVYPTTLLFGRDGKIRGAWRGYYPRMERDVEAVTRQVLAEGAAAK